MTDGERLVWAASYALALERGGDAGFAVQTAARAVEKLRAAAASRTDGFMFQLDERDFLDEIVNVP